MTFLRLELLEILRLTPVSGTTVLDDLTVEESLYERQIFSIEGDELLFEDESLILRDGRYNTPDIIRVKSGLFDLTGGSE